MNEPWRDCDVWINEKAFFNWLREQSRRIWSRHPIKSTYKNSRRFKANIGIRGNEIWACECEICGKVVRSSDTQIDHIRNKAGFSDWDGYIEWLKALLVVDFDDIRELCKDCHSIVTHSQRTGLSFDEAKADKKAKRLCDENLDKQFLTQHGVVPASTKTVRRRQVFELINKTGESK